MIKNCTTLILVCCTLALSAQSLNDLSFGTDTSLEVISWNIEWFPKNEQTTANYVGQIINNLNADIYALQEIDDTTLLKQTIEEIGGYECYFKSSWYGGLAYIYNTNTIQNINHYEIYTEEPYWNIFPRSPQVMEFSYADEDYYLFNNHFKCCGDETIEYGNTSDEECRRLLASNLLKEYVDSVLPNENVLIVGDLNDYLTDAAPNNVFQEFLEDSENYVFADMAVAQGSSSNYSYPTWPSHLDHILITNELFDFSQETTTIKIDEYMNSWYAYEEHISDHRPVGWKGYYTDTLSTLDVLAYNDSDELQYQLRGFDMHVLFNQVNTYEQLSIYSMEGKRIREFDIPNNTKQYSFSIKGLAQGAYFFSLSNAKKYGKFIVH